MPFKFKHSQTTRFPYPERSVGTVHKNLLWLGAFLDHEKNPAERQKVLGPAINAIISENVGDFCDAARLLHYHNVDLIFLRPWYEKCLSGAFRDFLYPVARDVQDCNARLWWCFKTAKEHGTFRDMWNDKFSTNAEALRPRQTTVSIAYLTPTRRM